MLAKRSLLFNILSYVCHSFPSKEQGYFNFMEAVTIHSDFGTQGNKICQFFHYFPSICHEMMGLDAMILVIFTLSFKSAFHSPFLLSLRNSLVLFTFCHQSHLFCISEAIDISHDNLDSNLWFTQPGILHDVFCI